MDEELKQNSKLSVIKYFLIITGIVFILNFLLGYRHYYFDGIILYISHLDIFGLPFLRSIYWMTFGRFFYDLTVVGLLINIIISLGINYMIAFTIVNNLSNNNNQSPSSVLTIKNIIINSFTIAQNNFTVILGASILWILTIWIPYLNVGTTIGMWALVVGLSKTNQDSVSFSPTSIFDSQYRKHMGEVFLLLGFIILGVSIGYAFLIIPGLVISLAWQQSVYLLIDKDLTPLQAIKTSNNISYGEKLTIFFGYIALILILGVSISLIGIILAFSELFVLVAIFTFIASIISFTVMIASAIYIYGELSKKLTNH